MGHTLSHFSISKTALSASQENLVKTINALKFKASGTAMKHFIQQGWVDDKLKIAVPKKAIMGKTSFLRKCAVKSSASIAKTKSRTSCKNTKRKPSIFHSIWLR